MSEASMSPSIVLFDGVCSLCNGTVRFILERNPTGTFRFASLDSEPARRVLRQIGVSGSLPDSLVLVEDGRAFVRSTAVLRMARRLRFPWPLVYGLIVVPRPVRDWIYDIVARHRYRWFGKEDACMLPPPGAGPLFLE